MRKCTPRKLTQEKVEKICSMYDKQYTLKRIAQSIELSESTVGECLNKHSEEYKKRKRTPVKGKQAEEQREKIKELWNRGLGISEIAQELNKHTSNITTMLYQLLGKENVLNERRCVFTKKGRKWNINEFYFEKIDTEDKAYLLGLLYADGCLSPVHADVQLYLSDKDKELIELFNKYTEYNRPIELIDRPEVKGFSRDVKSYNRKPMCGTKVCSTRFRKFCEKQGLTTKKSLTIQFPTEEQVPVELQRHFIRGYFDGDGSIYTTVAPRGSQDNIKIAGNEKFCRVLSSIIKKQCNINVGVMKHPTMNVWYSTVYGRLQVIKAGDYMYTDSEVFLKRKYIRYINIKNRKGYGITKKATHN